MTEILDKVTEKAILLQKSIVFPESHDERVLKAVQIIAEKRIAIPILLGNPDNVWKKRMSRVLIWDR